MADVGADRAFSDSDPIAWFRSSFARALTSERFDPARAALATVDPSGRPAVRFVLVKQIDERGFAFFTSYDSPKAADLAHTESAALAFHWESIAEQVRVAGAVERIADAESDAYFASRPRGSQLAAWASTQSAPIEDRAALDARYAAVAHRFADTTVPRPAFWGGFRLVPRSVEFWRSRDDRLHDRWLFTREPGWRVQRQQP